MGYRNYSSLDKTLPVQASRIFAKKDDVLERGPVHLLCLSVEVESGKLYYVAYKLRPYSQKIYGRNIKIGARDNNARLM